MKRTLYQLLCALIVILGAAESGHAVTTVAVQASPSVAGGTTVVDVSLENLPPQGISGIQFSLQYNPDVVQYDHNVLGASAAGSISQLNGGDAGNVRGAIVTLSQMSAGTIVRLYFTVPANKKGQSTDMVLLVDSLIDATYSTVPSIPRNATLAVVAAGDCNVDGVVSIAEVQRSINMFLGLTPAVSCVDANADSVVSIAEVQKTINSFLGL